MDNEINHLESPEGQDNPVDKLLSVVARLESKLDARTQSAPAPEKRLKSARLDVQHSLNAEWISRLAQIDSADPNLATVIDDIKARNTVLRKADAKPEFFAFFDNFREAEPDIPFSQCVSEALKKFNELEATRPRAASSFLGRKRPFRSSGAGSGHTGVAFGRESGLIHHLSQVPPRIVKPSLKRCNPQAESQVRYVYTLIFGKN
ncbi:hypothetical protein QR680_007582 [Steinernema hermaphroditum]|uniref:Uncharacterized protein n=1 Tax=Steinernema hermaphroditum TaxID=289476 RepID=A0AA39IDL6_9BILA|nr:hypothetical protein QR680_007582 [Steinernema hermaphroditum]